MATIYEIKRRIRSVKNTRQITKAMQLVAGSKMKKAQERALNARPYLLALAEVIHTLSQNEQRLSFNHPLFKHRESDRMGVLVIGTDRGLCGGLNTQLIKELRALPQDTHFFAVGKKVTQYLKKHGHSMLFDTSLTEAMPASEVRPIMDAVLDAFLSAKIDRFSILYPRFVNTLEQKATLLPILPIQGLSQIIDSLYKQLKPDQRPLPSEERGFHFEPSIDAVLEQIAHLYLKHEIHKAGLETKASEHSARVVAMKKAADNATELVSKLTLEYNKLRQAAITQEILEIAAATLYT